MPFSTHNLSFGSFGTNQTNQNFSIKFNKKNQSNDKLVASTKVRVTNKKKGTKKKSWILSFFYYLYYGEDLISNN